MLLTVHAVATWFMVGLIWFVQVVHYPLFAAVGDSDRAGYGRRHAQRTTWVVAPVMTVEALTALWLAAQPPPQFTGSWLPGAGAALVVVLWLSTALIQVPLHNRLGAGGDRGVVERLVRTNWLRTALWTARGAIAAAMLT